jgi:hypothetical protein
MRQAMGNDIVQLLFDRLCGPVVSNWAYKGRLQMHQGKPNASDDNA